MSKIPSFPVAILNFLMVASLAAIWIAFAPVKIGGQASYVMVNGNSMEPGFHKGDLAIVKTAPSYSVGEIVTYHDGQMNASVIHRIIGVDQDHYILKGDNNSWVDSYHPDKSEIIGKLWIHAPQLANGMQWLQTPINMALTTAFLGGILMASMVLQPKQHGKNKNKPAGNPAGWIEMTLYVLGFMALAFLGLSIFAYSHPLTRTADNIKYQQTGVFFYSAAGSPGIYDTEMLRSGEPVFTKLTCLINVGFVYNLVGDQFQEISGSQQLNAYVADSQSGWQRTIPLKSETAFNGASFSNMANLDLCQVQALVASVEQQTGFRPSMYTITIIPHVSVAARVDGQDMSDTFESKLIFNFDRVHFYLANKSATVDVLHTSKDGIMINTAIQPNNISMLGLKFDVLGVRILGLVGLGIALAGLLILGWYIYTTGQRSPDALIRIKYGSLLMDVYDKGFESTTSVIDVTTIDDLAKLAVRQNVMILHMTRDFLQYYIVQSEGSIYRYVISVGRTSLPATDASRAVSAVWPQKTA